MQLFIVCLGSLIACLPGTVHASLLFFVLCMMTGRGGYYCNIGMILDGLTGILHPLSGTRR